MATGGRQSANKRVTRRRRGNEPEHLERVLRALTIDPDEELGLQLQEEEYQEPVRNGAFPEDTDGEPVHVRQNKFVERNVQKDKNKRPASADRRMAQELADRELAYHLQMEVDREMAEEINNDRSGSPHRHGQPLSWEPDEDMPSRVLIGRRHPQGGTHERRQAREDHGLFLPWLGPGGAESSDEPDEHYGARGGSADSYLRMLFSLGPLLTGDQQQTVRSQAMNDPISFLMNMGGIDFPGLQTEEFTGDDYEALWDLAERLGDAKDHGMSEEEIESLPTSMIDQSEAGSTDDLECKICYSEIETEEIIRTLPCCHRFHAACIDRWIKTKATCPVCRMDIKEEMSRR